MKNHQIKVQKTAHYYTIGEAQAETQYFWIVAHGYGQLASRIIRKFDIVDVNHFVLAPEGFSRFYWDNNPDVIAASWMTKKDRLFEIEDYTSYIQQLYEVHVQKISPNAKIILFGFSQGVVSLWRWLFAYRPKFDYFISWAGWIADDLDYGEIATYLSDKKLIYVLGTKDEYYFGDRFAAFKKLLKKNSLEFDFRSFEGKHEVKREKLLKIIKEITNQ